MRGRRWGEGLSKGGEDGREVEGVRDSGRGCVDVKSTEQSSELRGEKWRRSGGGV